VGAAPLASIVVPTHNRSALLARCMDSLLAQEPEGFEIVIVDDGSGDDTRATVARYEGPRVRYLRQEQAGSARARNVGAAAARGAYLIFMDDDDEVEPTWFRRLLDLIAATRPAVACCGQVQLRDGRFFRHKMPIDMGAECDHLKGRFLPGTYAIRREVFEAVGGFQEDLRAGQHAEMAIRLAAQARERDWTIACVDEPLVLHHLHDGSRIRRDPAAVRQGAEMFLDLHGARLRDLNPKRYAEYCALIAVNAARQGDYKTGRRALREAIRARPGEWKNYTRLAILLVQSLAG
jgi:glycosyltransferase involved in cell wall biosynthesis